MKCPKCEFENPEGMNFCGKCGAKLECICPKCSFPNPPLFDFCGDCGHNLKAPADTAHPKDLSFDEKLAKIQRYLPSGLTEKVLSQKDKIEGERRQVTIMFVDMKGFTPLTEKLGPEETFGLMDQVFEILIHKVHDYEGTVNELRGDGILAFFGAPIALEDAPQRAIRSSLAIHREMTRFNDKIKGDDRIPSVLLRIGINTGPVVVGTVGNDLRVQFTAMGDTINMAARMEQIAEPGTTCVTGDTFKLTEGYFRFEALGEKEVKGKSEPISVYRVIAPSSRRTRFDVSAERGLTRFVGRERELELLLDGFERAKAGRGQAFSIVGEAGVGKSRLLYEFRKAVANEDLTFLEGKCLSYGRGSAYHPVVDILKGNFDVREEDGDAGIIGKVKKGLEILGTDEASTLPYLLELLSVKDSGIEKIQMSPEGKKDRIIEAIKRMVTKGSEIRPLVIATEDLHWTDRSSEDVLKYLLEAIPGARVLLTFTYRPEFVHTWGGKSYHSQLNLVRLSNRESLAMVGHLLGTEEIDKDLEELILEKTEGVPFFIEEFVRSLQELKLIDRKDDRYHLARDARGVTVPSTIQDMIMARVDGLPQAAKEVLQTGSVIEREFSYDLIRAVTGLPEQELLSHLSALKDAELLYERGIFPQSIYIFKHALTREVVYDSILTKLRKRLHERTASAIEELYKTSIPDYYGVLADHYVTSGNYDRAAEFSRLAGKKAMKTPSVHDAIAYAEQRISCLERLPHTDDVQKKMIDSRTRLGLYYTQINYHIEARQAIDPIVDSALRHHDRRIASQVCTIMGACAYWAEDDFPKAFKHFEEALKISEESEDLPSRVFAMVWLGNALSLNCEFDGALSRLQSALNVNMAAGNLWAAATMTANLSVFAHCWPGRVNLGYQTSHEALRMAEESGDTFSKATAYVCHGICCYGKGFLEKATEYLLKGTASCQRIDLFSWNALAVNLLGETYFDIGEYAASENHYRKAVELLEASRFTPSWVNLVRIGVARAKVMDNRKDIDLDSLGCRYFLS